MVTYDYAVRVWCEVTRRVMRGVGVCYVTRIIPVAHEEPTPPAHRRSCEIYPEILNAEKTFMYNETQINAGLMF